ncbi:MAG: hypothetical protein IT423_22640 [Pirellulaceae bacterium]|nr:hypothetical protein [Pirellulaceae bacterium]
MKPYAHGSYPLLNFCSVGWCLTFVWLVSSSQCVHGIDHILTIGGGYAPEGNQASLEANVLFFQQVIATKHSTPVTHRIQFADGFDPGADLQILIKEEPSASPAIALLEEIFAAPSQPGVTPGSQRVGYRNHRVPGISGSNRIGDIRTALDVIKGQVHSGDRLIVYVTAHGGSAKKEDPTHETSITCWGNRDLNMSEMAQWLDTLPDGVPVVLVMAQCYCGGFAHTIFSGGDSEIGLSPHVRTGFFAQRSDLPAAGCRPDVENDEEYSSYFWGALLGRTRSGKPALNVDVDGDGKVSLAEAHAFAVVASETVDIPLRGSDTLLRHASRIDGYEVSESQYAGDQASDQTLAPAQPTGPTLATMSGTLQALADKATVLDRSMIVGLARRLDLDLKVDVSYVFAEYSEATREYRAARRGGFGRRGRSGYNRRRDVRDAIIEKWPELEDQDGWARSNQLRGEEGQQFIQQVRELPAYSAYMTSRQERERLRQQTFAAEMRQVRLRRLIHTLETVVLMENLLLIGTPEMIVRYQELTKLERSFFE